MRRARLLVLLSACVIVQGCSSGTAAGPESSAPASTTAPATVDAAKAAAKAPDSLTLTCSTGGAKSSSTTVRATKRGVELAASSDSTNVDAMSFLAIPDAGGTQFSGELALTSKKVTRALPAPPGRLELSCLTKGGAAIGPGASITVYDPDDHYEAVDAQEVLGCEPKAVTDGAVTPARSTRKEALDRLATQLGPADTVTLTPGPGYDGAPEAVLLIVKRDKGYGTAVAKRATNGSWTARVTARC